MISMRYYDEYKELVLMDVYSDQYRIFCLIMDKNQLENDLLQVAKRNKTIEMKNRSNKQENLL